MKALHDKINKAQGKRNQLIDLLLEEKIDKNIYQDYNISKDKTIY